MNECAPKMQSACEARGDSKKAYIEGPPDCGGNGWYCRILIQDGWDPMTLVGDLNFGYCNTTEGFNDPGYDQSGHCHGSDDDSTYYWWIRDHWYRGYNGRLRCCCNWSEGDSPLTDGKVSDRCDYRRLVVDEDDAASCRDANEDHDQSFEGGCTGPAELNEPIEEDDSMCWELHRFGYIDEYGEGGENYDELSNKCFILLLANMLFSSQNDCEYKVEMVVTKAKLKMMKAKLKMMKVKLKMMKIGTVEKVFEEKY